LEVATCWLPKINSLSQFDRFQHAFRITVSMNSAAKNYELCKLTTHHLVISADKGKVEKMNLFGFNPVMQPGDEFSYVGCTSYMTQKGFMKGTFQFKPLNGDAKSIVDIQVPEIELLAYPVVQVDLY